MSVAGRELILTGGRGSATKGFSGYYDDVHVLDLAEQECNPRPRPTPTPKPTPTLPLPLPLPPPLPSRRRSGSVRPATSPERRWVPTGPAYPRRCGTMQPVR